MRIAFDCAYENTPSKNRGIGRYSTELLSAITDSNPKPEMYPWKPLAKWTPSELKEGIRNFISDHKIDVYHVQSPFDYFNYPELKKDWFSTAKVAVTLYDLIPFKFPQYFMFNEDWKNRYERLLEFVESCDLIFSISESTKKDLIDQTGVAPERVKVISAGVSPMFKKSSLNMGVLQGKGITNPYVLYAGGGEIQKNIAGIIKAFGLAKKDLDQEFQLVIAGDLNENVKGLLELEGVKANVRDQLIFTGYVSEQELIQLFSGSQAFVFPSLYEGFGLPVLEAMACGTPVITSNASSLPEVAGDAALLINSKVPKEIASAMIQILTNPELREELIQKGYHQAQKFTWESTARHVLEGYQSLVR